MYVDWPRCAPGHYRHRPVALSPKSPTLTETQTRSTRARVTNTRLIISDNLVVLGGGEITSERCYNKWVFKRVILRSDNCTVPVRYIKKKKYIVGAYDWRCYKCDSYVCSVPEGCVLFWAAIKKNRRLRRLNFYFYTSIGPANLKLSLWNFREFLDGQ